MTEARQRIFARGRTHYVLTHGVLRWGLGTATAVAVFNLIRLDHPRVADVVIPFLVFPMGGLIWGIGSWMQLEKKNSAG